ncbi:hypothetical protein WMY93_021057 [Mugilogobius chulae]|uniref:Uncharacterized protein n=1 Tax=Mugilogobius chulae TaxID=88201 RepID=A0AAW0N9K0_9GOBI
METQIGELKGDIATLREDTKMDIKTLREELTGDLTRLSTKQAEAEQQFQDLGQALSNTMDRVAAMESVQEKLSKKCKTLQEKCIDLENRSRRRNLRFVG